MKSRIAALCVVGLFAATGVASPPESGKLIVHEWGTFTSFAGSDGVPVGFRPDNSGLPDFVYRQEGPVSKDGRLAHGGTVSLETPVLYFYTDRPTRASVRVDFPKGSVTEWYPWGKLSQGETPWDNGRHIQWNVSLRPGSESKFPRGEKDNVYYRARETEAVPVQAEVENADRRGVVVQQEKFLFYRGVGTFSPPVLVKALGNGRVRVTNADENRLGGLILLVVSNGKIGFKPLPELAVKGETEATMPTPTADSEELANHLVKELTAAGLYPKEARAMVRTWETAWFGEDGTRLLYFVNRKMTDAILQLTVEPKPTEVARVLVGRHDFVTPEREAEADRQVSQRRAQNGRARELKGFGRFTPEIELMALKRLEAGTAQRR